MSGSGLPTDLSQIRIKNGQVVIKSLAGPAGELLDIMEDPDDPRFLRAVRGVDDLIIKTDDAMLSPHLLRLRKLAKSDSPAARAVAVKALGTSRNLEFAPTLIYALDDSSPLVVRSARDALRFVSRKFGGFGLSLDADRAKKAEAIEKWKQWYRSVRPDADFDD